MPNPNNIVDADTEGEISRNFTIDKKIPVAVLLMLVIQFVVWIWGGAVFYTNQQNLSEKFEENFKEINVKFEKIESTMFSRQEAVLQINSLRDADRRQEEDIRHLEKDFREVLLKGNTKNGTGGAN